MLSEAQKFEILRTLCYPYGTLDPTSMDYSTTVERRLNGINGQAQIEVEKILEWISQTEDQLDNLIGSQRVKRVDDIEFFENPTDDLRRDRRRYIDDLCSLIGLRSRCKSGSMGSVCV